MEKKKTKPHGFTHVVIMGRVPELFLTLHKFVFYQMSLFSAWRTSFDIFYSAHLQVMNSFTLICLKHLYSLFYIIYLYFLFHFSTLKFKLHCLLAGIVSDVQFALIFLCAYECNILPGCYKIFVLFQWLGAIWL